MPIYTPPTKDQQFILHDLLKVSESDIPGYSELDPDFTSAVLEEAGKIAVNVLLPINASGDQQGCTLENGVVRTPDGFKEAFATVRDGGWTALDANPDYGGQGMPYVMQSMVGEYSAAANVAFAIYNSLTHDAVSAIDKHGTDAQKAMYLPKMIDGTWSGTMNLTEPQCGTDLGMIRTKAEPEEDGSYRITGQKIWISGGEQDLTENIVHLVLAKLPGAPDSTKGISLFLVPKFIPNEDGSLGERNSLSCGGLEEKMGIHGNATCVMNYDGATGWLIGEPNKGMAAMFTMMNKARLAVAMQGLALGDIAHQNAVGFARDRLQGRDVTGVKNPDGPADPIIVHPDVRRNLMDQKSLSEGMRCLLIWGCTLLDRASRSDDKEADELFSLLIPVLKGFLTDKGFETAVNAQQLLGGSGYTREWGIEQFVRDVRIAMIYEGTNGIQSLDLVGRKLPANGGKAIMAFFEMVKSFIKDNEGNEALKEGFLDPLKAASKDLQAAGMYFMAEGMKNPNNALSGSYDFMHMFGHVAVGLMWAQMGKAAMEALDAGATDVDFYETKIATGRYYMARQLPATALHLSRIQTGAEPVMALEAAQF